MNQRALNVLEKAEMIGCNAFVTSHDIVNGNNRLNLAFVANLFNKYPCLKAEGDEVEAVIQETREEKSK